MTQKYRKLSSAISLLLLLLLIACTPGNKLIGNPQAPYPLPSEPEVGQIVHLPTGTLVSEEQMLEMATDNSIVYVGETHDNPASHRLQLAVIEAMAERYPGKVAIGMEMFTPTQDATLQEWTDGELTEKAFLKDAGWYKVWTADFDLYRDIFEYARKQHVPILGLNADKETVKKVVVNDFPDLPAETSAKIPEIDPSDPYHQAMTKSIYGGHSESEGMLAGFHRVQTLWDETMAESIVRFLEQNEGFRMVVLAGGNHVRYGFGIPRRVFRRLPVSYVTIGGKEIVVADGKDPKYMDVTLPTFPMVPYDFLVFNRYEKLDKEEVKLGVMLEEKEGQVVIKAVVPESNAERAGLLKDDIIVAIDGEEVQENFDLVYAIKQKQIGDGGTLKIERGDETLSFVVEFQATTDHVPAHHPKEKE